MTTKRYPPRSIRPSTGQFSAYGPLSLVNQSVLTTHQQTIDSMLVHTDTLQKEHTSGVKECPVVLIILS